MLIGFFRALQYPIGSHQIRAIRTLSSPGTLFTLHTVGGAAFFADGVLVSGHS